MPASVLPPTPAAIALYFIRRHGTLTELSPDALRHNDRLWTIVTCGLSENELDPALIDTEKEPVQTAVGEQDAAEGMADRGNLLTAIQRPTTQGIPASKRSRRLHRARCRPSSTCETCGDAFEQKRGPASKFCPGCRKGARQEAARLHMRLIRGGLAEVVA